ncbi:MAG: peroxiredoxin [Parachlamydiaceae bacterium]|nr:peroxiredoxin [Parachlamydiaceae bacterium]
MAVLVGKQAPEFHEKAVIDGSIVENFSLSRYIGKHVVFFFYPLDFTFVCPTELHAFQDQLEEFKKRNTEVVACSVDSAYTHLAWVRTPKNRGGIEGIEYPLVADITKSIANAYGVLMPEAGIASRGLFLIDKEGIVRHQVVNDLPLGRSVDEVLRTLDALLYVEAHGEACPANWQTGKLSMKTTHEGLEHYFRQLN